MVFFSFQQGGDSTYAAALGMLTVIVSVALMLSTLLLAGQAAAGSAAVARLTIERLAQVVRRVPGARRRFARRRATANSSRSSGASGCGKTTLLRQIAGFDKPDARAHPDRRHGRLERRSGTSRRSERRIGIVFQSYALWPHMTVAENVAYGLTVAGVKEPERARRVAGGAALVELDGFAERRPALLSGGQRQRVALARCLVTEPSLVLLDEPLANLDVHLRAAMEHEFARFHERTGTTMIYITHDQAEAMALADRIAVMDKGRVLQFATPSQLYREPADETVARFIGEGMVVPVAGAWRSTATGRATPTCSAIACACVARAAQRLARGVRAACARQRCGSSRAGTPGVRARVDRA